MKHSLSRRKSRMVKAGIAIAALATGGAIFASQAGAATTTPITVKDSTAQYPHDVLVTSGGTQLGCVQVGPNRSGTVQVSTTPSTNASAPSPSTLVNVTEYQGATGCGGAVLKSFPILVYSNSTFIDVGTN